MTSSIHLDICTKTIRVPLQNPFTGHRFRKRMSKQPGFSQRLPGGKPEGFNVHKNSRGSAFDPDAPIHGQVGKSTLRSLKGWRRSLACRNVLIGYPILGRLTIISPSPCVRTTVETNGLVVTQCMALLLLCKYSRDFSGHRQTSDTPRIVTATCVCRRCGLAVGGICEPQSRAGCILEYSLRLLGLALPSQAG